MYQPPVQHPVYFDGVAVNTQNWMTGTNGVLIERIEGWFDAPEVRDVREPRPGWDGEFVEPALKGGRTLTLSGRVSGSSYADLQAKKMALAAVLAPRADEAVFKLPVPSLEVPLSYATDFTSGQVAVPFNAALNPTPSLSIEAWIRRDADSGATEVIVDSTAANGLTGYRLRITSGDKLEFLLGTGAAQNTLTGATSLAVGTIYHVAATYNGTNAALYLNGVSDVAAAAKTYAANASGAFTIGGQTGGTNRFNGVIEDVILWSSVLSADTLLDHYTAGTSAARNFQEAVDDTSGSPVAWWRLDDSTTNAADSSGGYPGTLSGTYSQRQTSLNAWDAWTHADEIHDFERVNARVIEGVVFAELEGKWVQPWTCSLRASDPLVYADVETTEVSVGIIAANYDGTADTPLRLEVEVEGDGTDYGAVTDSGAATAIASTGDTTSWDADLAGYTTTTLFVLDSTIRSAHFELPQNLARKHAFDPIAFWRLNESAGTTIDNYEGTAGYDGTSSGTPTLNQDGPATDMKSISFDGVDDYIAVPFNAALHPDEWTWEAWFNLTASQSGTILGAGAPSTGFRIDVTAGVAVTAILLTSTGSVALRGPCTASAWNHVALTYKEGYARLYVNGALCGATPLDYDVPVAGDAVMMKVPNAGSYCAGKLSSVGVYGAALSESVIGEMFNGGAARSICRYGASRYVLSVNAWPHVRADTGGVFGTIGQLGATTLVFREARL